jgi:membrane-associated protease RseP (regulator of RpoE activity)
LLILGVHEFGHYFAARRHRVSVSLPYFLPAPFIGLLGTFGAFIRLREPMRNRKVLMDVGVAGPLAGFLVAIPILLIGLATSRVGPMAPQGWMEGNSILYALSKILVFGHFVPDGHTDVYLNQMAMAGWAGLLVTALNLIPIGQLDGGHILYSMIGQRAKVLYYPLVAIAFLLSMRTEMWLVWALLIIVFGRVYAAPLDTITALNPGRRAIGIAALVIFILTFVPLPITLVTNAAAPAPRDSAFLMATIAVGMVMLWRRARR